MSKLAGVKRIAAIKVEPREQVKEDAARASPVKHEHANSSDLQCFICKKRFATPSEYESHGLTLCLPPGTATDKSLLATDTSCDFLELIKKDHADIDVIDVSAEKQDHRKTRDAVGNTGSTKCVVCGALCDDASLCHICKTILRHEPDLKEALTRLFATPDDSQLFLPCLFCGHTYTNKLRLRTHMAMHSWEERAKAKLKRNDKQKSAMSHAVDVPAAEPDEQEPAAKDPRARPYACNTCGKAFTRLVHLANHKETHLVERPSFSCSTCLSERNLKKHVRKKHASRQVAYVCGICQKAFWDCGTLRCHHQVVHCKGLEPVYSVRTVGWDEDVYVRGARQRKRRRKVHDLLAEKTPPEV